MQLVFNAAAADPNAALVRDVTNTTPATRPVFVAGDNPLIQLYVSDGAGGYDADSGSETVTPSLGIGQPGGDPVALQTSWTPIDNGWEARLNCNTEELFALLNGAASVAAKLELQLVDGSGNVRTVGQSDCLIRHQVIAGDAAVPVEEPAYYTAAQMDAIFGAIHRDSTQGSNIEGVTETLIATVAVPALGVDDEVCFSAVFTRGADQNDNTKLNIKLAGSLISCVLLGGEPVTVIPLTPIFSNRGATDSQLGGATAAGALLTGTADTSAETSLTFHIENQHADDDCRLQSLTVRRIKAP